MKLYFKVPPEAEGMLLRGFLRRCSVSTDLSRAVKFRGSGFFADGAPVLANRRVEAGQVISFELPPDGEGVAPQDDIPVDVVYEDAFALVVEKPPHLAVHPTLNYPLDTLANGYAAWALRQGRSPVFRPVNRIDKDTSGLVLAAQNGYAAPLLAQRVEKLYYAVVEGKLPLGPGVIDAPIGRQGESIIGRCVTPDGKPSRTEYTILKAENGLSLAACAPIRSGCSLHPSATRWPAMTSTAGAGRASGGRRSTAQNRRSGCRAASRCRTASASKCRWTKRL